MQKKNPKIIFEFEEKDGGFTVKMETKGRVCDRYIYGIKQIIDSKIAQANENKGE